MGRDFFDAGIQFNLLLISIALGSALGVLYDCFRIVRIAFLGSRALTVAMDVLFWISSAFISFFFVFAVDNGNMRTYFIIGEVVGFLVYYFTLGRLIMHLSNYIVKAFKKFLSIVFRIITFPLKKIYFVCSPKISFLVKLTKNKAKISTSKCKFSLKRRNVMLYNKKVK